MNQEFNDAETESKLRMELVYQEVQRRNKAMDKEYAHERGVMRGRELKREWVGLTEDEIPDIYVEGTAFRHGVKWAEARLKEKNK